MVALVKKHIAFLMLILTTERKQALVLLNTITLQQAKLIYEVFHNIMSNSLHLETRTIGLLRRYKSTIKYLSGRASVKNKQRYIKSHKKQVFTILRLVNKKLLPYIDTL